uniref:Uncharacterized protein n=1 Tax=Trieres chinensis TaxID=1514140 RepID=A0A7S1YXK0_TRICV|mmetsp:Transcript_12674/g.26320  ORF Transcript_12674/g.26320 Transcript_12674/m.26320 type:complete len:131 (+) Transcript_12674:89-481(+)
MVVVLTSPFLKSEGSGTWNVGLQGAKASAQDAEGSTSMVGGETQGAFVGLLQPLQGRHQLRAIKEAALRFPTPFPKRIFVQVRFPLTSLPRFGQRRSYSEDTKPQAEHMLDHGAFLKRAPFFRSVLWSLR